MPPRPGRHQPFVAELPQDPDDDFADGPDRGSELLLRDRRDELRALAPIGGEVQEMTRHALADRREDAAGILPVNPATRSASSTFRAWATSRSVWASCCKTVARSARTSLSTTAPIDPGSR